MAFIAGLDDTATWVGSESAHVVRGNGSQQGNDRKVSSDGIVDTIHYTRRAKDAREIVRQWVTRNEKCLDSLTALGDNLVVVRYEDLVT